MRILYWILRQKIKEFFYKEAILNYYGSKIFYPKKSFAVEITLKEKTHVYELDNLKIILDNVEKDSFYFDIGANIGLMSIPVLQLAPDINVVSIEASPTTFQYLSKTHKNYHQNGRWKIFDYAISDTDESRMFHVSDPALGVFDSFYDTKRGDVSENIILKSKRVDQIWEELNYPKVSFIKIDIEGAEMLALLGAEKLLATHKPSILLEWNEKNILNSGFEFKSILKWAKNKSYLLTTTNFTPILNAIQLKNFMQKSEYFLLTPIENAA